MTGASIIRKYLEERDIKYVFGIPGDEIGFIHELENSKVTFYSNRHEQASAFMAESYGRLKKKAGVCTATFGPGALNLMTGLGNALLDRSPVVAFIGEVGRYDFHEFGHQNIDVDSLMKPVTKGVFHPHKITELQSTLKEAFRLAESELPGPVAIIIPDELMETENSNVEDLENENNCLNEVKMLNFINNLEQVEKAKTTLQSAQSIVAIVGNLPQRRNAVKSIRKILEIHNIPTYVTIMGKGIIAEDSKIFRGILPRSLDKENIKALTESEILLLIGFDLVEGIKPAFWNLNPNQVHIHVGCSKMTVPEFYTPDIYLIGEPDEILNIIIPEKLFMCNKNIEYSYNPDVNSMANPELAKICTVISNVQNKKDDIMFFCDIGMHKRYVSKFCKIKGNSSFYTSNGLSTMGYCVPSAIAGSLICPDKTVISISGDGGFLANVQELELVTRNRLKTIFIVICDGGYGLIKKIQLNRYGKNIGTSFMNPDFISLGKAFNIRAFNVNDFNEMEVVLNNLINKEFPGIIAVHTDYNI